jgi:hypothetical protein
MRPLRVSPKVLIAFAVAFVFPIQKALAIGDQHGLFRSQSTQGAQWMGTAVIEDEEFRITVHPDYLDVELDWVFRVGGQAPEKFQDALEIVGNLNLARNSVVVGMLTWWKGDILMGKLKTSKTARADYEEVVQRDADAPPPPRDPVLIEYGWGLDNYDISIFPAKFGDTRKVRIHYLVPATSIGGTVKIPYPYAFSEKAKVTIQAGSDIASYKIEAGKAMVPFTNKSPLPLSETDFSFRPYGAYSGSSQAPRVQYIVPVLAEEPEGSRFYVGEVDQPDLKGQAAHIVVMDARKIIAQSDLKEDFVILWHWSHTAVLNAYAGQIVGQSKLLKAFLSKLEGADKRAALVIDKEGGERITFALAKAGDPGHVRLIAYLDSLAALAVKEPPVVANRPDYQLAADVVKAQAEFQSALKAAMELFDGSGNIRHLLILTAGPQLIYNYAGTVEWKIDSLVQVAGLVDYAEHMDLGLAINPDDRALYWPGVAISGILSQNTLNLEVAAVISNGNQLCSLAVAGPPDLKNPYQSGKSEIEKHVFSAPVLLPKVHWTITRDGKVISEFEETAGLVPVENPLALAQLLGASRALTPMAARLPRSLAAAVGFVDSTYSLVALEEDKLTAVEADRYASAGMPPLSPAEIKASPEDLLSLPASEWILENPPQRIWNYGNSGYAGRGGFDFGVVMDAVREAGPIPKGIAQAGAFMPMPIAGEYYLPSTAAYPDYTRELAAGIVSARQEKARSPLARVKGRVLLLEFPQARDLAARNSDKAGTVQVEIFDIAGSLLYSESFPASAGKAGIEIPLSRVSSRGGLCLLRFKSSLGPMTQKIWLPAL